MQALQAIQMWRLTQTSTWLSLKPYTRTRGVGLREVAAFRLLSGGQAAACTSWCMMERRGAGRAACKRRDGRSGGGGGGRALHLGAAHSCSRVEGVYSVVIRPNCIKLAFRWNRALIARPCSAGLAAQPLLAAKFSSRQSHSAASDAARTQKLASQTPAGFELAALQHFRWRSLTAAKRCGGR